MQDFLKNKSLGFTLLEIMAAVVIIGILAAMAYPVYVQHGVKANRTEAKTALMDLAARMERYYMQNHSYEGATIEKVGIAPRTLHGHYELQIAKITATTFTIQAVPEGTQAKGDAACGSLTLNQLNQKGITGPGNVTDCW